MRTRIEIEVVSLTLSIFKSFIHCKAMFVYFCRRPLTGKSQCRCTIQHSTPLSRSAPEHHFTLRRLKIAPFDDKRVLVMHTGFVSRLINIIFQLTPKNGCLSQISVLTGRLTITLLRNKNRYNIMCSKILVCIIQYNEDIIYTNKITTI